MASFSRISQSESNFLSVVFLFVCLYRFLSHLLSHMFSDAVVLFKDTYCPFSSTGPTLPFLAPEQKVRLLQTWAWREQSV